MEREFNKSMELSNAIDWMINNIESYPELKKDIVKKIQKRNKSLSKEGIVYLIVKMRGELSHFINNPRANRKK